MTTFSRGGMGRPSIPPERLLRAQLLQIFYSIRSDRLLMEQLDYNLLYRWFVGLSPDDPVWDPTTGQYNQQWSQNTQLAEPLQGAVDSQMQIAQGRSQMGEDLLGQAREQLGSTPDWGGLQQVGSGDEARQRAEDAIYQRATSRLDPQWQQQEGDLRSRLYNQGLREGDAAFDREVGNFGKARTAIRST